MGKPTHSKEIMAESENEKKSTPRESMLSRARERYPDRTFADIGAEPQEGTADLDEAISEMLEEYATRQKEYDENNSRLSELLMSDPSAAEFLQSWLETGDPRTAMVETLGDELGMSEEGREKFKGQLDGWRERKAANDALEAEAAQNWQDSLTRLEEWGNAKGLTLEQKRDVMLRLLAVTFNGMENKYAADDFDLAFNGISHDADVAAARSEGEVTGRNARIAATRRDSSMAGSMPPSTGGGQGATARERRPARKEQSPWAGVR